jgi:enoyl-CoA hydratase
MKNRSGNVDYAAEGATVVVTLQRPEVRNCVDGATAASLAEAFRRFDADESLSVAILTGAEGCFCAGADLKVVAEHEAFRKGDHRDSRAGAPAINPLSVEGDGPMGPTRMLLDKPVIAAVEGFAVAGGLELALWCDLRVAARDAVFGVYCRRWGVPLVDGGTVRLPRIVGQSVAMDMILTGRGVSGDEASRVGLVNRLVEPGAALDAARALAEELAAFPQRCLRADRRSALTQWSLDLDGALAEETLGGLEVIRSGETAEGAARFAAGAGRHGRFGG